MIDASFFLFMGVCGLPLIVCISCLVFAAMLETLIDERKAYEQEQERLRRQQLK